MKKECKDCDEQARLNGMGAEREARLMARMAEVEKERDELKAQLEQLQQKFDAMGLIADDHAMARVHLKEQRDEALAQCAVLREALEEIVNVVDAGHCENGGILAANAAMASWARKALSSTSAGADILERVKRLEGVKDAAGAQHVRDQHCGAGETGQEMIRPARRFSENPQTPYPS